MSAVADADYHPAVVDLFTHLDHAGSFAGEVGAVQGEAGVQDQGASVRLWIKEGAEQRIAGARFEAYGCPHFLAAAESLCRWLERRSRAEIEQWPWRAVETELAIPVAKRARLLILEDALRRARTALKSQS